MSSGSHHRSGPGWGSVSWVGPSSSSSSRRSTYFICAVRGLRDYWDAETPGLMALKPDTKVVVASGHGARESTLQAIERGAYDFYQKPVDIDQLGLIVRRAFQLHGIESELDPFPALVLALSACILAATAPAAFAAQQIAETPASAPATTRPTCETSASAATSACSPERTPIRST